MGTKCDWTEQFFKPALGFRRILLLIVRRVAQLQGGLHLFGRRILLIQIHGNSARWDSSLTENRNHRSPTHPKDTTLRQHHLRHPRLRLYPLRRPHLHLRQLRLPLQLQPQLRHQHQPRHRLRLPHQPRLQRRHRHLRQLQHRRLPLRHPQFQRLLLPQRQLLQYRRQDQVWGPVLAWGLERLRRRSEVF
jgi:hypothetical protein